MDMKPYRAAIEIVKTMVRIVHFIIFLPLIALVFVLTATKEHIKNEIKSNDNSND